MLDELVPYGGEPLFASRRLLATASRTSPDQLFLSFIMPNSFCMDLPDGEFPVLPRSEDPSSTPQRGDELWRGTCFEAFVRRPAGGYYEINLTTDRRWAVYAFTGYRVGMRPALGPELSTLGFQRRGDRIGNSYCLRASIDLSEVDDLPHDETWSIALSAVLKHQSGRISYWALAHPADKPDFHHPDSFVLELPPPSLA